MSGSPDEQTGGGYLAARNRLHETRLLLRLAGPVMATRVSMLAMGIVDTWMVGRLGPVELASVALGDACFFTIVVLGMGVVQSLDPLVSQAFGAGEAKRCARAWRAGLLLSVLLTLPLVAGIYCLGPLFEAIGSLDAEVVRTTEEYLAPRTLGILPSLAFLCNRCLLNGMGDTRPAMVVALLANLLNVVLDWMFIFGNWGAPALGVAGSGLTTAICRWFMFLALLLWLRRGRYRPYTRADRVPLRLIGTALRLGIPMGLAGSIEMAAFATASIFMGWMGVIALASHQIAIRMAAVSFIIAVALGTATGIRVGNAIGAGRPALAQRSAWVGLGVGLVFMCVAGVVFLVAGEVIVGTFSPDPEVIALGSALLVVAAAFQLSDGAQAICSGALRGAGDTVRPLIAQIVAHWGIGLPLAYVLAFQLSGGPQSIWWAIALGLTVAALLLAWRLRRIKHTPAIDRDA